MSVVASGTALAVLAVGSLTAGYVIESSAPAPARAPVVHRGPPGPAQVEKVDLARAVPIITTELTNDTRPGRILLDESSATSDVCASGPDSSVLDALACSLGSRARELLADLRLLS